MNENDRKFFLKRFFSFNNSNSNFNSVSSNGSINEGSEADDAAQINKDELSKFEGTKLLEENFSQTDETKISSSNSNLNATTNGPLNMAPTPTLLSSPPLPAILVDNFDDRDEKCMNKSVDKKKLELQISVNSSNRSQEESYVSTPSSTAPLLPLSSSPTQPSEPFSYFTKKKTPNEVFFCDPPKNAKVQLQQQNSIELKPFRKKGVQILDQMPDDLENNYGHSNSTYMTSFSSNLTNMDENNNEMIAMHNELNSNNKVVDFMTPGRTDVDSVEKRPLYIENVPKYITNMAKIDLHNNKTRLESATDQFSFFQLPAQFKYCNIKYRFVSVLKNKQFQLLTIYIFNFGGNFLNLNNIK